MTSLPNLDHLTPEQLRALAAQLMERVETLDHQVDTLGKTVTTVPTATLVAVREVASLAHPIQNHSLIQVESLLYPADFAVFVGLVG